MMTLTNTYNAVRGTSNSALTIVLIIAVIILTAFLAWAIFESFRR